MTFVNGVRVNRGAVVAANDINGSPDTVSEKAIMFNDNIGVPFAANVFNEDKFTVVNKAAVCNDTGLTAAVLNAICDNANISTATIKAILDTESITVASQLGAMLEGTQLSLANASDVVINKYTVSQLNNAFINAIMSDDRAQQILSEIAKTDRDLTSATNIYEILDDWDDNKLTSRDGAETTPTGFTNLFAQKTKFRPEWATDTGSPSAGSGVMTLPASARVHVSSTLNVGTWECLMVAVSDGDHSFILQSGGGDKYKCTRAHDATIGLYDAVDSVWIIGPVSCQEETIASIIKMTRNGSSGWEIFENGVSKGTVTDNTTTSFNELHLIAMYQSSNFDDLKVY